MKSIFVAWTDYHRRSEILADHVGAELHFVDRKVFGGLIGTAVRYALLARQTWHTLCEERPDVVFVQNPPIFCAALVSLYAALTGARYVIDSHTGAFVSPKWRWSLWLHRLISRRAEATIVHNRDQQALIRDWGCPYIVLGFMPGEYPAGENFFLDGAYNVAVVSSFRSDEPLEVVFDAARQLADVRFYITGNDDRIPGSLLAKKPENCILTGYLSYEEYVGLMRGSDAIVALTTQDHTLLMGGFEAVSLGVPLIVSNWPVLRDYFSLGTVHVPNTAEGLCEGVRRTQRAQQALRYDMVQLRQQLEREWEHGLGDLKRLLVAG